MSTAVLTRHRLSEEFYSPAPYIVAVLTFGVNCFFISDFVAHVDSFGFDYRSSVPFTVTHSVLSSLWGESFAESLFYEGPIGLCLFLTSILLAFYVGLTVAVGFSSERANGALEVFLSGPVNRLMLVWSFALKALVVSGVLLSANGAFLILAAVLTNLQIGTAFLTGFLASASFLLVLVFLALFCSVVFPNVIVSTIAFVGFLAGAVVLSSVPMTWPVSLIVDLLNPVFWHVRILALDAAGRWASALFLVLVPIAQAAAFGYASLSIFRSRGYEHEKS